MVPPVVAQQELHESVAQGAHAVIQHDDFAREFHANSVALPAKQAATLEYC